MRLFVGLHTRGRKVVAPKMAHSREVWGNAIPEVFKVRVSEIPFLVFSAGYFQ